MGSVILGCVVGGLGGMGALEAWGPGGLEAWRPGGLEALEAWRLLCKEITFNGAKKKTLQ